MTQVMKASTRHKFSNLRTGSLSILIWIGATFLPLNGQEVECPSEGVSYISHLDCTRYIICVNGLSYAMGCPRPLYYNAEERHCDFPENVPKCIRGTRPPVAGSVITTSKPGEESGDSPTDVPPTDPPSTDESPGEGEASTQPNPDGEGDSQSSATEKPSDSNSSTGKPPETSTSLTTTSTTEISTTTIKTTKKPKPTKTTKKPTNPTTTKKPTNPTTTTTFPPINFPAPGESIPITKCGETIHANSGAIEYKLDENYEEGELCSFIIRTDNFPHIAFMLDTHGIHDCDTNAITIVNFPNTNTNAEYYHFGPPNSIRTRFINGSAAVVIFKTGSNLGTGFRLSYHAAGNPGYPYPGMDFVYDNLTASPVSIPFWDNFTMGYPQKNLIVLTAGGKMITEHGSFLKLTVWESFVCGDFEYFTIFPFDGKSVTRETVYTDDEYADEYRDRRTVFKTKGLFIVEYTQFSPKIGRKRLTWEKVTS